MNAARSLLVLFALAFGSLSLASEEGVLPLGTFRIQSPGIGESGPVTVSGTQTSLGVQGLTIEAFGKTFQLTPAQLQELPGGFLNGIQLSYEAGYKELGGRTIYVLVSQGFTSGVTMRRYVVVKESGTIRVWEKP